MKKKKLILLAISALLVLVCLRFSLAQEQLTITTYYPSPSGSYNELNTNFLRLNPYPNAALPATAPEGTILYKDDEDAIYFRTGVGWATFLASQLISVGSNTSAVDVFLPTNGFSKPTVVVPTFTVPLTTASLVKIEWAGTLSIWANPKTDAEGNHPIEDEGAVVKLEHRSKDSAGNWQKWRKVDVSEVITDPRFDDVNDDDVIDCGGGIDTCPPAAPYDATKLTTPPVEFFGNDAIMALGAGDHQFRVLGKRTKSNPAAPADKNLVTRADAGFSVEVFRILAFP